MSLTCNLGPGSLARTFSSHCSWMWEGGHQGPGGNPLVPGKYPEPLPWFGPGNVLGRSREPFLSFSPIQHPPMAGESSAWQQALSQTASTPGSFIAPKPLLSPLLGMPPRLFCPPGQLLHLLKVQLMSLPLSSLLGLSQGTWPSCPPQRMALSQRCSSLLSRDE